MGSKKENERKVPNLLAEEENLLIFVTQKGKAIRPSGICRKKNREDSEQFRKNGNEAYQRAKHNEMDHEDAWKLYTQSIALAPNDSEELALGYGNRSALLFHLEKYEDSIKDCDRAIKLTDSDILKAKLMFRKAECLAAMSSELTKSTCEDALQRFTELKLDLNVEKKFTNKLHDMINTAHSQESEKQRRTSEKNEDPYDLYNFVCQKEIPCASESVKIMYNEEYGRHVVATKDIQVGEIIAIEKCYYTFIKPNGKYLYCSFCCLPSYSSIPCEHCIYDVYCSENCKSKAWTQYHQFECPVYPHLWDISDPSTAMHFGMRFLLKAVHDAGGIDGIRQDILDIQGCKDLCLKGFSPEGILESNKPKIFYSLTSRMDSISSIVKHLVTQHVCTMVYLLATKTDFFGKKVNSALEIISDNDMLFIGALFIRTLSMLPRNSVAFMKSHGSEDIELGMQLSAFGSLLNHNCYPNTHLLYSKNNESIIYASTPIKKGSQLFLAYISGSFLMYTKEYRQIELKDAYNFTCNCQPCIENWTSLPSKRQDFEKCLPELITEISNVTQPDLERQQLFFPFGKDKNKMYIYSPMFMSEIIRVLDKISKHFTPCCEEYLLLQTLMKEIYEDYFGTCVYDVSSGKCSTSI